MRNTLDVQFPDERVARIVADRLTQVPFDIILVGPRNPIYPLITIRHATDNLQSNRFIVGDRPENRYRLANHEKREVPDPEKYWKWNLGNGFSLRYFPPSFDDLGIHRGWLGVRFSPGILPVSSPYFWFTNVKVGELFDVRPATRKITVTIPRRVAV